MKIKTTSWHYELIDLFDIDYRDDLCSYTVALIKAIFFIIGIICVVSVILHLAITPLLYLVACLQYGFFSMKEFAIVIGLCVDFIILVLLLNYFGLFDYIERLICRPIEFIDE